MPSIIPFLARFASNPRTGRQQNPSSGSGGNGQGHTSVPPPRPDRTRFTEVKDETADDA